MSEMGDSYDPGPWKGYNFGSARMAYDPTAGRGYGTTSVPNPKSTKLSLDEILPPTLKTNARSPLLVVTDGTDSMGIYPQVIFKKLPLLDLGVEDYLDDPEIAFGMVGDVISGQPDKYALQMQPFGRGKVLEERLNKLIIEGGGGGNQVENYDVAALYCARNIEMPNAVRPILIYICDEGIPNVIGKSTAEHAHVKLEKELKTMQLFKDLTSKYSVYCIRKHYQQTDGDVLTGQNAIIHKQWQDYIGEDRVALLGDPERVVDVIFGILAADTDKLDFFQKELTYRQKPEQIATVMKSITTMTSQVKLPKGNSKLLTDGKSKKSSSALA